MMLISRLSILPDGNPAYNLRIGGHDGETLGKLMESSGNRKLEAVELETAAGKIIRISGEMQEIKSLFDGSGFRVQLREEFESACRNYSLDSSVHFITRYRRKGSLKTLIMGILNVTPDSFSDGGKYYEEDSAVNRAIEMAAEGADLIDIGGESTRPGAAPVDEAEELRRIVGVITRTSSGSDIPVSVDTMKPGVARAALESGARIVNDVTGLASEGMRQLVAESGCDAVIMHMKGSPRTMQQSPVYGDVVYEVGSFLSGRVELCMRSGIDRGRLMVDPGIGFGKTLEHNLQLLRELDAFRSIGCPVLLGASRKSFISKIAGRDGSRLEGSIAAALAGYQRGACVLRVHDVKETRRALSVMESIDG